MVVGTGENHDAGMRLPLGKGCAHPSVSAAQARQPSVFTAAVNDWSVAVVCRGFQAYHAEPLELFDDVFRLIVAGSHVGEE